MTNLADLIEAEINRFLGKEFNLVFYQEKKIRLLAVKIAVRLRKEGKQ